MSKHIITFTGDPQRQPGRKRGGPSDPDSIVLYGLTFQLGEPTQVEFATSAGQAILAKLRGHSHFTIEDVAETKSKAKAAD